MTRDKARARRPGALTFASGDSRDLSERLIAPVRNGFRLIADPTQGQG